MAERQKEKRSILSPNLSPAKKALLLQVMLTPGWKVVEELANEACLTFTQDILRLDPESEDYERVNVTRTLRARNASEFSELLFRSIVEHANAVRQVKTVEEAPDLAGEKFGIHPAKKVYPKIDPTEAIKNVYGIHPARPKKVETK
jgi:hypothetical protein